MNLRENHLKFTREFLGIRGNPEVHKLLDLPGQPATHRATHTPQYIELVIKPMYGEEGAKEAWLHILIDFLYPEKKKPKYHKITKALKYKKSRDIRSL